MSVRCPTRNLSTPTRHLSYMYDIYTRHVPYVHQTYTVPYVHQMPTRHPPDICQIYGICLVYMSYMSDRCLVGVDRCLVGHLAGIWQSSGREHQTNSNCLAVTVEYGKSLSPNSKMLHYSAHDQTTINVTVKLILINLRKTINYAGIGLLSLCLCYCLQSCFNNY